MLGLVAVGFLTLSSFTTVPTSTAKVEKSVSVRCHITVYSHSGSHSYVDNYYFTTDTAATCNSMAEAFLDQ